MPARKGLLAPQNTFLDTIATRFDGTRKFKHCNIYRTIHNTIKLYNVLNFIFLRIYFCFVIFVRIIHKKNIFSIGQIIEKR